MHIARAHAPFLRSLLAAALLLPAHTTTTIPAPAAAATSSPYQQPVVAIASAADVTDSDHWLKLANGNIVVADQNWTDGVTDGLGAVFLYDGNSGALISRLTGSHEWDAVAKTVYASPGSSTFVVVSSDWNESRGAATWVDGSIGLTGVVTVTNSLVGSAPDDEVGVYAYPLANGNWAIYSPNYRYNDTGYGAVTWAPPAGITGVVDIANSLIGPMLGAPYSSLQALSNGNYMVFSRRWATWADGAVGLTGVVTTANSLFFGSAWEWVDGGSSYARFSPTGNDGVVMLQPSYGYPQKLVFAALRSDGPTTGTVTTTNSFTGSLLSQIAYLRNGNLMVCAEEPNGFWESGTSYRRQAMRWGTTASLISRTPSDENRLWSPPGDWGICHVYFNATPLSFDDGRFVMLGRAMVGPEDVNHYEDVMTIVDSSVQVSDFVTMTNALFSNGTDGVFQNLIPLTGTVFLLHAQYPSGHALARRNVFLRVDAAVGVTGSFTSTDGLYLDIPDSATEDVWVSVLDDGNYVIASPGWGGDRGLVHWASWNDTTTGELDASNSMVGECAGQKIGAGVSALRNGRYVIGSAEWEPCGSPLADLGAVTWMEGGTTTGTVNAANSIIGDSDSDQVGSPNNYQYSGLYPTLIDHFQPYDDNSYAEWKQHVAEVHESGDWSIAVKGWNRGADEDVGAVLSLPGDKRITGTIAGLSHLAVFGKGAYSGSDNIFIKADDSGHTIASAWQRDDYVYLSRVLWPSLVVHVVGDGKIHGSGVDCGATCTVEVRYDTPMVLTATANGATPFAGWSGACSGTQSCSVPMTTTTHVTATFGSASTPTPTNTPTPTPTNTPTPTPTNTPTPTPTNTPTPTPTNTPTPTPTSTSTPATAFVAPRYGPAGVTSTVSILGPEAGGFTGALGVYVDGVSLSYSVRSDEKIDFSMPPGASGSTVDVVLIKAGGVPITFTHAYTFEAPTTVTGTTAAGAILTTTSGVTIVVPPQTAAPITGSMTITYTPVDAPASPPGNIPLSNFDIEVVISGSPVGTITNPSTFAFHVDAAMVPSGQEPQLFQPAPAGGWIRTGNQSYNSTRGLVTVHTPKLGTFSLATTAETRNIWVPFVIKR